MSSRKAAPPNGEAIASKRNLLDELDAGSGSGSEDDQEEGGVTLGPSQGLKINEEYARRFEHNKKREELHRLEEKYSNKKQKKADGDAEGGDGKEGSDSSDSESEDDDGYLVTEELDTEISAVLKAIKNKDPRIYDKDAVFYKPSDPDADDAEPKEKKEKPVFLQDYHRERYLAGDTGAEADEGEARPKTYIEAQDDLKKSIVSEINAAGADSEEWSEDETFLKPKEKPAAADDDVQMTEDGVHPSRAAAAEQQQQQQQQLTELDVANADKNPEAYLTKFMAARAWVPEDGGGPSSRWAAFESDDEDEDDKAAAFEHAYNMRFEDPEKSNEVLMSYSRNLTAARSARREELTGRKKQRALEKERKEAEKKQRDEERARLRRLKLDEAAEKLAKIKEVAGLSGRTLADEEWIKFLDEAWDDDKWEEEMTRRFGEEYYAEVEADDLGADEADEADEDGDEDAENETKAKTKSKKPKKPKWDDDIDITDIVPDFTDEKAKPDITLSDSEEQEEQKPADEGDEENDDEEDSDAERPAKKRKTTTSSKSKKQEKLAAKREARQELAKLKALVDQKMELDTPRALAPSSSSSKPAAVNGNGGERPAFRYRETSPDSFGLTARDILLAPSDAALNQFVGLKKLATFRDADKKRRDRKRLGKKARLREWRRETFGREFEHTGPTFGFDEAPSTSTSAAGATTAVGKSVKMKGKGKPAKGKGKEKTKTENESSDRVAQQSPLGGDDGNVVDGERKKKRKRSKKAGKEAECEEQ